MPELPEVETIAVDLNRYLKGKTISSVELINKSKVLKTSLSVFKKAILRKKVKRVYRRAKMLLIDLGEHLIVFHLKMTGQLIYTSKKTIIAGGHPIQSTGVEVPNKFTCLIFSFTNGEKLYFNDLRKFGWVKLLTPKEFLHVDNAHGPEPLDTNFSFKKFSSLFAHRQGSVIKAALLDQKVIAGLGNIYVDEVLFRSKIRPNRRIKSLSTKELQAIWKSILIILHKSISERGTTFSNFLDPAGLRGNFVPFLKVYGRGGKPCLSCGHLIKKTRLAGRGTHWCERCQR